MHVYLFKLSLIQGILFMARVCAGTLSTKLCTSVFVGGMRECLLFRTLSRDTVKALDCLKEREKPYSLAEKRTKHFSMSHRDGPKRQFVNNTA